MKGRLASEHSEFGYESFSDGLLRDGRAGLASEHSEFGYARKGLDLGAMKPGFGLFSTANDLLKFLSALGGLKPCPLTPLMQESMTNLSHAPDIEGMFHTGGGGFGGRVYAAYDKVRHRGVVIFSTVGYSGPEMGSFLLESQWQSDRRPTATEHRPASFQFICRPIPTVTRYGAGDIRCTPVFPGGAQGGHLYSGGSLPRDADGASLACR